MGVTPRKNLLSQLSQLLAQPAPRGPARLPSRALALMRTIDNPRVSCASTYKVGPEGAAEWKPPLTKRGDPYIRISNPICRAASSYKGQFVPSDKQIWALRTLAHEASHIALRSNNEALTEARALQQLPSYVRALGGSRLAATYAKNEAKRLVRTDSPSWYQSSATMGRAPDWSKPKSIPRVPNRLDVALYTMRDLIFPRTEPSLAEIRRETRKQKSQGALTRRSSS
jgi:hypothetical protein